MSTLSLFDDAILRSQTRRENAVPRPEVVNDLEVEPQQMRTGCCLASMKSVGGWNFNCFGNGFLTLYQTGCGGSGALTYRLNARLARKLRQIAAATTGDDRGRTRRVLELFGHPAAQGA